MDILLCTPPLTQLNTPYPATAYLKGFLKHRGYKVTQADLGIEMILDLFSKSGLKKIVQAVEINPKSRFSSNTRRILSLKEAYYATIEDVILFLQNKSATTAHKIVNGEFLPQAARFQQIDDMEYAFGTMGIQDKARYLATLYLEDIGDLIIENISLHFGFSRYAETLAMSATHFDEIEAELQETPNLIDQTLLSCLTTHLQKKSFKVVGFTVPFPGNLYGALRCAKYIKENHPDIKVVLGGGYVNTELRDLKDPTIFKYIDFITLDDGEAPFLNLLNYINGKGGIETLQRTFLLEKDKVAYKKGTKSADIPHIEIGTPDYSDLPLTDYLSVLELLNPMHRLWSDGRWNKLTIAHGCYWKRCSFCDITLDYIARYEEAPAKLLVDRIEQIIEQTGETGFHFVDEAAPPLALRDLAVELIRRKVSITWWTNIRFEKTFTADLCRLLAASGCIAVSGGLEVASDRLLTMMEKGVTIDQVARVTYGFTEAGIMVHAYLMYGFPTQTEQETVDSLEVVRQLFENGCIQSGFWHLFSMTAHSPVGKSPEKYQVEKIGPESGPFANNDLIHHDPLGADHGLYAEGLRKALFNYMHGVGFDLSLPEWFEFRIPDTTHEPTLIEEAVTNGFKTDDACMNYRLYWLGGIPEKVSINEGVIRLTFYTTKDELSIELEAKEANWLAKKIKGLTVQSSTSSTLLAFANDYEKNMNISFSSMLNSELWFRLRVLGLILIRF